MTEQLTRSIPAVLLQILGSVEDLCVYVWDARTGAALFSLLGHCKPVHVLEGHPQDPCLALSGEIRQTNAHSTVLGPDTAAQHATWPSCTVCKPVRVLEGHPHDPCLALSGESTQ